MGPLTGGVPKVCFGVADVAGRKFFIVPVVIGHNIIYGYADADFASDVDSRKSTTGWIFMYNGGAVSWGLASSLQPLSQRARRNTWL